MGTMTRGVVSREIEKTTIPETLRFAVTGGAAGASTLWLGVFALSQIFESIQPNGVVGLCGFVLGAIAAVAATSGHRR